MTELRTIVHFVDGKPYSGSGDRTAPVYDPATGAQQAQVRLASSGDVDDVVASAVTAAAAWRNSSLATRQKVLFAARELLDAAPGRDRRGDHRRARQGALRRRRRGAARPGGRRVRLRHPAPAQGRVQRGRLDRGRRLLDPSAARRRRGDLAVQLPVDGAAVVRPDRDRLRQRGRPQAEREGPDGGEPDRRGVRRRGPAAGRAQRRPRRQGGGRPAAGAPRRRRRSRSSGRRPSPGTSTRPAPATASGCRPSAARRTTCSCCRTPTWTSPRTPP